MTTRKTQLPDLLSALHEKLKLELGLARATHKHSGTMGDQSEEKWISMLETHLPARYQASKAFVIDSNNKCSDQIDVVIHDRQYSPFVLNDGTAKYVPAESVYAIFEVKQEMTAEMVEYAADKVASVRDLHRTSIPIPHAGGVYPAKPPQAILGGLLCLASGWSPPFGDPFNTAIKSLSTSGRLELCCVAEQGVVEVEYKQGQAPFVSIHHSTSLAYFLLRLIARLQLMATVPSLDVMAYAKWIEPKPGGKKAKRKTT